MDSFVSPLHLTCMFLDCKKTGADLRTCRHKSVQNSTEGNISTAKFEQQKEIILNVLKVFQSNVPKTLIKQDLGHDL